MERLYFSTWFMGAQRKSWKFTTIYGISKKAGLLDEEHVDSGETTSRSRGSGSKSSDGDNL